MSSPKAKPNANPNANSKTSPKTNVLVAPGAYDLFHHGHYHFLAECLAARNRMECVCVIGVYTDAYCEENSIPVTRSEKSRFADVHSWARTYCKQDMITGSVMVTYINDNIREICFDYNTDNMLVATGAAGETGETGAADSADSTKTSKSISIPRFRFVCTKDIMDSTHVGLQCEEIRVSCRLPNTLQAIRKIVAASKATTIRVVGVWFAEKKTNNTAATSRAATPKTATPKAAKSTVVVMHRQRDSLEKCKGAATKGTANIIALDNDCFGTSNGGDCTNDELVCLLDVIHRFRARFQLCAQPSEQHLLDEIRFFDDYEILMDRCLEEGGYGSLHPVVSRSRTGAAGNNSNPMVAKVMKDLNSKDFFDFECAICVRAGQKGYGPQMQTCYYSDALKTGVIIMDRWDGDMDKKAVLPSDVPALMRCVKRMHDDGIFHHDLYFRNVLYRVNPITKKKSFAITDFGLALPLAGQVPPNLRAADIASLVFGVYDETRIAVMDGVYPSEMKQPLIDYAIANDMCGGMDNFITGIKYRVINTIAADGVVTYPAGDRNFIDGIALYRETLHNLNRDILRRYASSDALLSDKMAYTSWLSEENNRVIQDMIVQWFDELVTEEEKKQPNNNINNNVKRKYTQKK